MRAVHGALAALLLLAPTVAEARPLRVLSLDQCADQYVLALAPEVPVWLPYVRGERTPLHRRDLHAALFDLELHHQPAAVLRAAHEAAA